MNYMGLLEIDSMASVISYSCPVSVCVVGEIATANFVFAVHAAPNRHYAQHPSSGWALVVFYPPAS